MSLTFYSSREERLSKASKETKLAYEKRKNKNFFKRNPQIRILIIDLVIILLFAVIIVPLFMKLTKDVRVDNYKIETKAFVYEKHILINLKIKQNDKKIKKRKTTELLKVAILSNNGLLLKEVEESFPDINEDNKYIALKLDDDQNMKVINIRLISGDYIKLYKVHIER